MSDESVSDDGVTFETDRRTVLRGIGTASVFGGVAGFSAPAGAEKFDYERPDEDRIERVNEAYEVRKGLAQELTVKRDDYVHPRNDDESTNDAGEFVVGDETFERPVASFGKGLPKNEYGETPRAEYDALRAALNRYGDLKPREFDDWGNFSDVTVAGERKLAQPEASLSFTTDGVDTHDTYSDPAPGFASEQTAAEMVELYWQALLRDVPFSEYETSDLARAAAAELNSLEGYDGPTDDGTVTPSVLFRGDLPGCLEGPYISQFHLKDFNRGMRARDQRLTVAKPGVDYMSDYDNWLTVQRGQNPYNESFLDAEEFSEERYMVTGRDTATYVHRNTPAQPFVVAKFILASDDGSMIIDNSGVALNPDSPYPTANQTNLIDYGGRDLLASLLGIEEEAILTAFYHKWVVHRRPRPEEVGGRVYWSRRDEGPDYPLDSDLLQSEAVRRTVDQFGTALLPQAYPEGSPVHPSFPAGHAVEAGTMGTVLKAFFDNDATLPNPKRPDPDDPTRLVDYDGDLTVAGEVNKLVANHTIGRNWSGIHYRTDASKGIRVGERVAAGYLLELVNSKARLGGVSFQTFDGERVTIESGDTELPDPLKPSSPGEATGSGPGDGRGQGNGRGGGRGQENGRGGSSGRDR